MPANIERATMNSSLPNLRLISTRSGAELLPLQVTKAEAAKLLGYSTRTIERLVDRGELRQIGSGRLSRFDLADLKAYQDRNRSRGYDAA
jgi:excisionase family DNA binding protein